MKIYNDFTELSRDWKNMPNKGFLYIKQNREDFRSTSYAIILNEEIEEEIEQDRELIPIQAYQLNMKPLIEVLTLKDIFKHAEKQNPNADEDTLFKSFEYYLDKDDFLTL